MTNDEAHISKEDLSLLASHLAQITQAFVEMPDVAGISIDWDGYYDVQIKVRYNIGGWKVGIGLSYEQILSSTEFESVLTYWKGRLEAYGKDIRSRSNRG